MAWQYVSRKGGGKGRNSGVQDQLLQSMTAIACPIHLHQASPVKQGTRKGQTSQGQGKEVKSSPGERKSPNLKPEEERAEPTTEEVKCPKCPNTYNWTTRVVCRSCGCKLPQGNVPKAPSPQKSVGPANVKTGGGGSSSGASSGTSYASVVKGETGPAETMKEEKGIQQKAESIEKWLAAMDKDDPLREDLESQLEQLRAALKDPRNPGARLDSAMAKMRKAKAKVQKCEEQLRQAEASLKSAQENAAEEEEMLKQCGLLAVAACEDASEAQAKRPEQDLTIAPAKLPGRLQNWQTQPWWHGWQTACTFWRRR